MTSPPLGYSNAYVIANTRLLGRTVTLLSALSALFGLTTANPLVTAFGLLLPGILWHLLWRTGHPAVLMFAAMFQWAQAFMSVLSANMEGKTLHEHFHGPELEQAAWLSLISVLALAVGAWGGRKLFTGCPES